MTRLVLPLVAIGGLFLPTLAHPAHAACPDMTLEERVQTADVIVTGTVTQVDMVPPLDEQSPDDLVHAFQATLAVDEYLKGSGPDTVTIPSTARSFFFNDEGRLITEGQSPGMEFEGSVGKRYILFLHGEVGSLTADLCLGSKAIDQNDQQTIEDVRAIVAAVEALPPTGSAPPDRPGETTPWPPIIASSLGLTLLAGGASLTLRAWRQA